MWVCIWVVMLFVSCNKEAENILPVVTISAPQAGSSYVAGDTLIVVADLSDNESLYSVRVVLNDNEGKPVLAPVEISIPTNPYHLVLSYPISDLSLAGGTYEIQVKASDGVSETNSFRQIQITALPREFLYPLVVTQPGSNFINVYSLENATPLIIISRTGDYKSAALQSSRQMMFICGSSQSDLDAYSLDDYQVLWSQPSKQLPHGHWFEAISSDAPYLLTCYYEGYVKGLDYTGGTVFTTTASGVNYPVCARIQNEYVIVNRKEYASEKYSLAWYNITGGTLRQSITPTPQMAAIMPLDQQKSLCFGNMDGDAGIYKLDLQSGTLTLLHTINNEIVRQVSAMDSDNYLIAGTHTIYWYRYSQNSLVEFVKDIEDASIACENIGQQVFTGSGKMLSVYSFPEGTLTGTLQMNEPITDILLLYNK